MAGGAIIRASCPPPTTPTTGNPTAATLKAARLASEAGPADGTRSPAHIDVDLLTATLTQRQPVRSGPPLTGSRCRLSEADRLQARARQLDPKWTG